jgi:hypothetical protein
MIVKEKTNGSEKKEPLAVCKFDRERSVFLSALSAI